MAFQAQDKGETKIGALKPSMLAIALLDWHLAEFFREVGRIEDTVDKLDEMILAEGADQPVLGRIVANRRRVSELRSVIAGQRPIFHGLSRPDFLVDAESDETAQFGELAKRFDRAVDEVERGREVVIGSFDLFTSMTTQQTNDLVKALTFITAIIGLCAAVAGLLGMSFKIPLFDTGMIGFLSVAIGLVALAGVAVIIVKVRHWI